MARGHIRKYKDRWAGVIEVPTEIPGKRKQRWVYAKTEKECQKKLNQVINEIEKNTYIDPAKLKVSEYFEQWMKEYTKPNVTEMTYIGYKKLIDTHILPRFGTSKIDKLKPLEIQTFYTNLLSILAPSSVLKIHRILHKAFSSAMQWQIININPFDMVQVPRQRKSKHTTWSAKTTMEMLEVCEGTEMYLPILIAYTTGMRRAEICGLQWSDIDEANCLFTISKQLQRIKGRLELMNPKTEDSIRQVYVTTEIIEILKEYKKDSVFVCAWEDGRPLDPDYITKKFKKLILKYELPEIRFHDLRHTHATELLKENINTKIISERLGHSSVKTTLDIYSHVKADMQKKAAQLTSSKILKKSAK